MRLRFGLGFQRTDLEAYGFTAGRDPAEARRYLGYEWYLRHVRPVLNARESRTLTENKWVFYRLAAGWGLPVPRTLGLFDPVFGATWDGERPLRSVDDVLTELAARRPATVVLKPAGGQQGKRVVVLEDVDHATGRARTRAGTPTTVEATVRSLDPRPMRGHAGYVVQEGVPAHPALHRLAPWTTNTVRVMTLVDAGGAPRVHAVAARLGRRGNETDNWAQGGVGVFVDLRDGALGEGVLKAERGRRITAHPDTGEEFTGTALPFWQETLQTCLRGARLFPGLHSLGWDVVLSPQGPVVLEANADWDLQFVQWFSEGLLADTELSSDLAELGVRFPSGSPVRELPGLLVRRAAAVARARLP